MKVLPKHNSNIRILMYVDKELTVQKNRVSIYFSNLSYLMLPE